MSINNSHQLSICEMNLNKPIGEVMRALEAADLKHINKVTKLRVKLVNLKIGD